ARLGLCRHGGECNAADRQGHGRGTDDLGPIEHGHVRLLCSASGCVTLVRPYLQSPNLNFVATHHSSPAHGWQSLLAVRLTRKATIGRGSPGSVPGWVPPL